MKYRVEERADADRPTKGFLQAAEVRAKRINIPALKRLHSTAKESSLRGMAQIARNFWGNISRAPEMGNLPLPDNQVDRDFFRARSNGGSRTRKPWHSVPKFKRQNSNQFSPRTDVSWTPASYNPAPLVVHPGQTVSPTNGTEKFGRSWAVS
jgi:hypothetical protein